jgi:hypothetical protein
VSNDRRRDAALVVCGHATDTDDARLLLTRLGLLVDGHLDWPEPGLLDVHDIKQVSATGAGGAGFR